MNKSFKTAPLPFMGQKRRFVRDFNQALDNYPQDGTYIDLFGGSGLLSHTVRAKFPSAKVVFNDYDGFTERLEAIPQTNKLLAMLRELLDGHARNKPIKGDDRLMVLETLRRHEKEYDYLDYITISGSLLFSGKYALDLSEIESNGIYNRIRKNNLDAEGYLNGIDVVKKDYRDLFDEYQERPNVVFLVDPPYLQTSSKTYKSYWKLKDYLDVLTVLNGQNYFYFTSNKSSIIELCEWIGNQTLTSNPFESANRVDVAGNVNYASNYTDIMFFK